MSEPLYMPPTDFIDTAETLTVALERLGTSPFVALDTEFLRERTYYPKFCLLQLAHDDYCAVIDVLALPTLAPVMEFLDDRRRLKVLHAAHQDLEVLALTNGALHGTVAKPIAGPFFDTQVAAAFLDMPANIGYADLVERRLGHTLEKGQARTDWSRRPLTPEQLTYAAADVTYLVKLYHDFKAALAHTLRWSWLEEDAARLEDPARYITDPSEAWRRLRGIDHLQPAQQAAAKALAEWRERQAMQKNLPRPWILADNTLRQLAEKLPSTLDELAAIKGLPRGTVEKHGTNLLEILQTARIIEREATTIFMRPLDVHQQAVRTLIDYVRRQSAHLHISPEYLASRREIEALVYRGVIGEFGKGWRLKTIGEHLIRVATDCQTVAAKRLKNKTADAERLAAVQRRFFPPSTA